MSTPDPEPATESEVEIQITDLEISSAPGQIPERLTSRSRRLPFHGRTWMSIAVIAGMVLLSIIVFVSVSHLPPAARVSVPPHINSPVSLTVVDGVCYATATNGVVTALRVSDGVLLWHRAEERAGEVEATVVDGVIYLVPLLPQDSTATTVTVVAVRVSDGSPLWSRTFPRDALTTFQLTAVDNVVYIQSVADTIEAARASDGSVLWHYTARTPFVSTIAAGMVYVLTQDDLLAALRASSGLPLWTRSVLAPAQPLPPVVADGMVFLTLQDGGLEAIRADTGVVLWRSSASVPAQALFPPLVTNGVVYALAQDGQLAALHASSGSTLWRVALSATDLLPPQFATGEVVYVGALDGSVEALRTSNGSVLWRHQGGEGGPVSMTVAETVIYLASYTAGVNSIGSITVLRASDGVVLWHDTPHVSATQVTPVVAENLVLIPLGDGSIDAFDARSGSLRWHRAMNS